MCAGSRGVLCSRCHALFTTGVQAKFQTSYDRRLRNAEFNHFLGLRNNSGRTELIMLSEYGPGCIKSIWMLDEFHNLDWHLYVDGAEIPVPPIDEWGHHHVFPAPLAGTNRQHHVSAKNLQKPGFWSYVPILFRSRCIITVSRKV